MKYTPNLKKFKNRRMKVRTRYAIERGFFALSTIDISDFFKLLAIVFLLVSILSPWAVIQLPGTTETIGAFDRISAGVGFLYCATSILLLFSILSQKHKEDWRVKLPKWVFAIDPDSFFAVSVGISAFFIAIIHSGLNLLTQEVTIEHGPIFGIMASLSIVLAIALNTREKKQDLVDRLYIENLTINPLESEYSDLISPKHADKISDKNLQLPL